MSEEPLAVKTMSLRKGSMKELSILQSLDHQNIVKLLFYHKNDKELHLLCEKMAITLYDKLDHEGAFELDETLFLAMQLFQARPHFLVSLGWDKFFGSTRGTIRVGQFFRSPSPFQHKFSD